MDYISKSNLLKAGIVGAAALLTFKMTATRGKLVQGLATVAVVAVALPLAGKLQLGVGVPKPAAPKIGA